MSIVMFTGKKCSRRLSLCAESLPLLWAADDLSFFPCFTFDVIDRRHPIEHVRHASRRVCRLQERDTTTPRYAACRSRGDEPCPLLTMSTCVEPFLIL